MDSTSSESAPVMADRRWWRIRLPASECHLFGLTVFIVLTTLVINRFLLPLEWAESPEGLRFVEVVARFYPGLRDIKESWAGYTPQVGVLFGSMALGMPVHLLSGLVSAFSLSDERYKKFIVESGWKGFLFAVTVYCFFLSISFFYPDVEGYGRRAYGLNQASESFSTLFFSWALVCGGLFISGQFLGALILKTFFESFLVKGRLT